MKKTYGVVKKAGKVLGKVAAQAAGVNMNWSGEKAAVKRMIKDSGIIKMVKPK